MSTVGRRYARALFSLIEEGNGDRHHRVSAELGQVADAFATEEVARLMASGVLDARTRREIADRIAEALSLSESVGNLLRLAADNDRFEHIGAIEQEYRGLVDERMGIVRAHVTTARPLSDESLQSIEALFHRKTGKKVHSQVDVDPALLGGVVVEIDGRVYDGSTRTRLERLRGALSG